MLFPSYIAEVVMSGRICYVSKYVEPPGAGSVSGRVYFLRVAYASTAAETKIMPLARDQGNRPDPEIPEQAKRRHYPAAY